MIIGAGFGGLAAALALAGAGHPVLVLDASDAPGGKARQQPSAAGPVDAGPTVLTQRRVFDAAFTEAGLDLSEFAILEREPLLARHFWTDGSVLDLWDDADRSAESVRQWGGAIAEEEFRAVDAEARRLWAAFEGPVIRAPQPRPHRMALAALSDPRILPMLGRTMAGRLSRLKEPRLAQLFGRYATYVGGLPQASPALLSLIWRAEADGVWRVRGGLHALAAALADAVRHRGGTVRCGTEVAEIELVGGRARAVHTSGGERIEAADIVFAGDPAALRDGLLGATLRPAVTAAAAIAPQPFGAGLDVCRAALAQRPRAPQRLLRRGSEGRVRAPRKRHSPDRPHALRLRSGSRPRARPARARTLRDHRERAALGWRGTGGQHMPDTADHLARPLRAELRSAAGDIRDDRSTGLRRAVSGQPRFPLRAEPARSDGGAEAAHGAQQDSGPLPRGGRVPSGGGRPDGGTLRPARGRGDLERPCFDIDVPPDGYGWWYVDGVSDDGKSAVSVIAFIGSVFSPWYAWSGRRDPENHCCMNVATYGRGGGRFAMTDRGRTALRLSPESIEIGPSRMRWTGSDLVIDVAERGAPFRFGRIRGRITLRPDAVTSVELPLTPDGAHVWRPFAPSSSIEVDLGAGFRWHGHGYFDSNFGTRALEADFRTWTWGRFPTPSGATCFYEAERRDGTRVEAAVAFSGGRAEHVAAPPRAPFRRSLWAVRRETRADPGVRPRQVLGMLDAPFYTRSAVRTTIDGLETTGVHEVLDLDRFRSPLMKPLLAVRVPRRARWP